MQKSFILFIVLIVVITIAVLTGYNEEPTSANTLIALSETPR